VWRILAANYWYRAAALTYLMIVGNRQPILPLSDKTTLRVEDVTFRSSDGVSLRGWFIPRAGHDGRPAPVIVFVHGWPWNRQGNRSGYTVIPDATVDFLGPARAFRAAGFHTLLFDLRNHGESGAALPVTFGVHEANDLVGAVTMLRRRADVNGSRIGVLGYSMGANAAIYGIPRCQPIRAAVAVQPVSIAMFARNFSRELLGPAGPTLLRVAQPIHQAIGAPPLHDIAPAIGAPKLGDTTVLYIQGSGDRWGSMHDVQTMAAATPHALAVVAAPSNDRYSGYQYVNTHIRDIIAFFADHLQ
jgi:pimeloyl-ACP methyl ester carboxylesterase